MNHRMILAAMLLAAMIAATGCSRLGDGRQSMPGKGDSPLTYSGTIPCADCPGQRIEMTLFADGTFRLRQTYLEAEDGEDRSFHDLGKWTVDGDRLRLDGGTEGSRQFRFAGQDRLRMLDNEGNEIRSDLNYELARRTRVDPIAGPMRLAGMYRYMADAASVTECLTGKTYPVPIEADHRSIERAYLSADQPPGEPVLAVFEGRFVTRAPEPGLPVREHIIVERFDRMLPGRTCGDEPPATATLIGTRWEATEIAGNGVTPVLDGNPPYLILMADGNRVAGFTGCNRLMGSFEQGSDGFRFGPAATTRMACPPPIAELEQAFLSAFGETAAQRIQGTTLELLADDGSILMRLEAQGSDR